MYKNWTIEDWKRVIWTDESSFHIGMRRGSIDWIWRSPDEEFHPDCIDPKKRETQGIMFWGAFRWGKRGPGIFFETEKGKHITAKVYCDQVINGPLYEFWAESFMDCDPIVMEDNARVHKGVCIKTREDLGFICLPHPPNSPDLNPIEHIWQHIKHRLAKEHPYVTSAKELKDIIMCMWEEFGDDQFNHLVESMPRRIAAIIKAKGGSIKY